MSLLNPHEANTPVWQKIEQHLNTQLAKKRERLENPRIAEAERIQLAWQIDTYKEFLALGQPEKKTAGAE